MANTTALEAIAPIVKWGYLYLYQADSAPGYEPPTEIQGLLVTPKSLFLIIYC
jgi:hypothetical protein